MFTVSQNRNLGIGSYFSLEGRKQRCNSYYQKTLGRRMIVNTFNRFKTSVFSIIHVFFDFFPSFLSHKILKVSLEDVYVKKKTQKHPRPKSINY